MEQRKTASRGMAVLLSAALVPTVGVPATAFADEAGRAAATAGQEAQAGEAAYQRSNAVDDVLASQGQQEEKSSSSIKIGEASYDTLQDAVDAIAAGMASGDTIRLEGDASGNGVVVKSGTDFTLDLGGFTYTVDGDTVGSAGTETNGFQLLKDSDIVIKNGTIKSDKAKILVQNYSNLTLEEVSLVGGESTQYALSNNNGKTVIGKGANVVAGQAAPKVAFDVCGFSSYEAVDVTVAKDAGRIEGAIELSSSNDAALKLQINGGDLSKASISAASGAEKVAVSKGADVALAPPQGCQWVDNVLVAIGNNVAIVDGAVCGTLEEAIEKASNDATIKMLKDISYDDRMSITGKSLTVDLNGCTLTSKRFGFVVESGSLTLDDTSADESGVLKVVDNNVTEVGVVLQEGGSFTMKGGTIDSFEYGVFANPKNSNKLLVEGGCIKGENGVSASGIGVPGCTEITITGGRIEGTNTAVATNGSANNGGVRIRISGGEMTTLNSPESTAVYLPGIGGETVITGGTITGATGVEVRAGSLDISGDAAIAGTGTFLAKPNESGGTTTGCGVTVAQHTTKQPISLAIGGDAKISGDHAFYEWNPHSNSAEDLAQINLAITGGEFTAMGSDVPACVVSDDFEKFITGGTFSSDPSEYVADGYGVAESNGKWTVSKHADPVPPTPEQPDGDVVVNPDGSTTTTDTETVEGADGTVTETVTETTEGRPDGSTTVKVTETVTGADGSETVTVTETNTRADGTSATVVSDGEGSVSKVEATVPAGVAAEGPVVLPMEPLPAPSDAAEAPEVSLDCPAGAEVTVPVATDGEAPGYGAVVMLRQADGSWRVLPKCAVGEEGLTAALPEDAVVKVVDASPSFPDVEGEWYGGDGTADFVGARGILTGMPQAGGAPLFDGGAATTRAMFVTMLHRLESEPAASGEGFGDAEGLWYEDAAAWGAESGVANGYGDGAVFGGDDPVTREQMAVFAMRYAAWLGLDTSARADLSAFADGAQASGYASEALSWAVAEGILKGHADGTGRLDPQGGATRAEASAVVMRLVNGMYE